MGYDIFVDDISTINVDAGQKQVINTLNPHSYVTAKEDKFFEEALRSSDVLLPDGSGIVLAAKQVYNEEIQKIAGSDLHIYLLEELNKTGGSVFYMGASQHTLDKIHERIAREYPSVKVGSYSPPFKPEFTDEENAEIIKRVNAFGPDVLFIGMTAPKQEKWLHTHKEKLDFKIASCIGAVFDFYAGTVIRPSQFWIDMHLEWLPRLFKEPKRLWRRNFVSTPLFLLDMFMYRLGMKK
ncbi:WecB/TagA/CpsF family glycosyltransferase [Sulfurovum riftiae]|nr:WecB/TagA/CpsF family glycosyltransferase [Sulfurovum riftiae]